MAAQTKIVGTCIDEGGIGTRAWGNPGNATANDNNDASTPNAKNYTSHYLKGTMGSNAFTIPSGATIDGIEVRAEVHAGADTGIGDYDIRLVVAGTVGTGNSLHRAPSNYWTTSRNEIIWGGLGEFWGLTLDDIDLNDSGFGASIVVQDTVGNKVTASVDYIEIVVYYTETSAPKDVDGESTTALSTLASITKITNVEGSLTTGLSALGSLSKETNIDGSLTTGVTASGSVSVVKQVDGLLTTGVSTDGSVTKEAAVNGISTTSITDNASVSKDTPVFGEAITAITAIGSVNKETSVDGELTTLVTTVGQVAVTKSIDGSTTTNLSTAGSVSKETGIDGSADANITTEAQVTKVVSIVGSATTNVSTSAEVTTAKDVSGSLTTGVSTDASITKTTGIEGSATTGVSTEGSVTKETSIEGSATTNVSTVGEVEKVGDKNVNGSSTAGITTSASITKVTRVDGISQTNLSTSASVSKETAVAGIATTGVSTDALITLNRPVEGSLDTNVATSGQVSKITGMAGAATTGVNTFGSVSVVRNITGVATTGISTVGSLVVPPSGPVGAPMFPFLSIIADGDTSEWLARPENGTPHWMCVSPGVTPVDRSHRLRVGGQGKICKFTLADIPTDLEIINYYRVYFDFSGFSYGSKLPGFSAGIYLDDVLFENVKSMQGVAGSPTLKMLEWTGLNVSADVFRNATKVELWLKSIDGGSAPPGDEPNFQQEQ